jgi:hypothetical protein
VQQLFSICIGYYAALPPVRSDPHWPHSHAITASIRLALTQTLQHPLLATQTSAVATTTCHMSRLSALEYRANAPIHGLTDTRLAYSQRILDVTPSHLARDLSRLSTRAYPNDAPIHALPTYLYAWASQRVLGVVPCPSLPDQTHTTHNTTTSAKLAP